ncbi:RNA polymerase sigma-70 factor [Prolixibacteraceae bacterium JC049]|nr:RNA polymerase sigma-70 factor [Prolixibacteraceae bacterium JC049]
MTVQPTALIEVSFDRLYETYFKRSVSFVKSYVHDEVVAEDLVSETLMKVWMYTKKNDVVNLKAFLYKSLRNTTLDYLKKERLQHKTTDSSESWMSDELELRISLLNSNCYSSIFATEIDQIFQDTLSKMPPKRRKVIELSRIELKSNKEIANELGLRIKGVDYHIYMGLKMLREALKDYLSMLFFMG